MNDFDKFHALMFDTPDDLRGWVDAQVLSKAQRRRALRVAEQWETELGQGHVEYLNERSAQIRDEHKANSRGIEECQRETAETNRLMAAGRLSSDEGTKRLAHATQRHQEALKIQASLHRAVEEWEVESDRSPVNRLREQQERFRLGVPSFGKKSLTAAILNGDDQ